MNMVNGLLHIPGEAEQLLERAVNAFRHLTDMGAQIVPYQTQGLLDTGVDAIVEFEKGTVRARYATEVKLAAIDRFKILETWQGLRGFYREPRMLVVPYMTAEMAERCRLLKIPFLDAAGNAYLDAPGLFVYVAGRKKPDIPELNTKVAPHQAFKPTGMRVIFALLLNPALAGRNYRDIAKAAGVALGTVGWVLRDLHTKGYLHEVLRGEKRLYNPDRLMQEWVAFYPVKLRPKLNVRRFRAPHPDWWKNVDLAEYEARWGGEVAADKLTGYLKPATFTIYLHGKPARLILEQRLRPDVNGDIEVLEAFWDVAEETAWQAQQPDDTAPPLLAYADLMATTDSRNLETARMIYDRYLANAEN
ncbi:MAG: hypothetical protein K0M48_04645 [Thiobacillus sp.]|nr:hypothetical protein [Thiobacillus sp.]